MWDWLYRWRQRDRDLQQGVDADLVHANQRRWKICAGLFGLCFLLLGIQSVVKFQGTLHQITVAVTVAAIFGAIILGNWARSWDAFLNKPDPKEPPRLWRWRG